MVARVRGRARGAATVLMSAAIIVSAHGTVKAPPRLSWPGVRRRGTHSPFRPAARGPLHSFLALRVYTAHPVRSFRSLVIAAGIMVHRFGPFEFIDADDRLPSV